jgi:hypothetical protein
MGMGKETQRSAEMQGVLEEYASSGMRRKQFCEQRGISLTTFDYWRRALRAKPRMVKVKIAAASEPLGHFVLNLANGRRIESSWGFVDAELARLIRIVESA